MKNTGIGIRRLIILAACISTGVLMCAFYTGERYLSLDDAYGMLVGKKAVFIDARKGTHFDEKHIPGAINIEPGKVKDNLELLKKSQAQLYIVYCYKKGGVAGRLAKDLIANGITNIAFMKGNWDAWIRTGYPYESGRRSRG